MRPVCIATVGAVEPAIVHMIERELQQRLALPARHGENLAEPAYAWNPKRRQYNSPLILAALLKACPADALRLVALTGIDLYIPMLSFIYGQAQLDGAAAIVSLARLRQEFHGLPADRALLFERARKEVFHELGHTFGLVHCPDATCVMALATNIRQLDLKLADFCAGCSILISEALGRALSHEMKGHG